MPRIVIANEPVEFATTTVSEYDTAMTNGSVSIPVNPHMSREDFLNSIPPDFRHESYSSVPYNLITSARNNGLIEHSCYECDLYFIMHDEHEAVPRLLVRTDDTVIVCPDCYLRAIRCLSCDRRFIHGASTRVISALNRNYNIPDVSRLDPPVEFVCTSCRLNSTQIQSECYACGRRFLANSDDDINRYIETDAAIEAVEAILTDMRGSPRRNGVLITDPYMQEPFFSILVEDHPSIEDEEEQNLLRAHVVREAFASVLRRYCNFCLYDNLVHLVPERRTISSYSENRFPNAIHDYSYKPSPEFYLAESDDHHERLFFGVELEVEMRSSYNSAREQVAVAAQKHFGDFAYLKYDGSLSSGFEIVSHPATFKYWVENDRYRETLTELSKYCRSFNADSCGIHIHMSKDAFSGLHLARFLHFLYNNPALVEFVAQRTESHYAAFRAEERNSVLVRGKEKSGNYERYVVANLQPPNTMEIRIFKGNMQPQGFMKNIEFCHALYQFTCPDQLDKFNRKWDDILDDYLNSRSRFPFNSEMNKEFNVSEFTKFVTNNSDSYPNLYMRLQEGDKIEQEELEV